MPLHRRRLLAGAATLTAAVAGCSGVPATDDTPEALQFEELHQTPTCAAEAVDLALPDEVPTESDPDDAELLLVPGDTNVDAQQTADWLAADRAIALLGDDAEPTWIDWKRSDAFAEAFENEAVADNDPDPQLLVGVAVESRTATYNRTWADGPRERDLLRALDEILVDVVERTPR